MKWIKSNDKQTQRLQEQQMVLQNALLQQQLNDPTARVSALVALLGAQTDQGRLAETSRQFDKDITSKESMFNRQQSFSERAQASDLYLKQKELDQRKSQVNSQFDVNERAQRSQDSMANKMFSLEELFKNAQIDSMNRAGTASAQQSQIGGLAGLLDPNIGATPEQRTEILSRIFAAFGINSQPKADPFALPVLQSKLNQGQDLTPDEWAAFRYHELQQRQQAAQQPAQNTVGY